MSKSKGNVISPTEYFENVGADALRLFHLFVGPATEDIDWNAQSEQIIEGCGRYLRRVWRIATGDLDDASTAVTPGSPAEVEEATSTLVRLRHKTIRDVSAQLDRYGFNTAVAALMELTNAISKARQVGVSADVVDESVDTLLLLLAPMAPHLAAEAYEHRHQRHIHEERWPSFDAEAIVEATVTMVVQVDGKLRSRIEVPVDITETDAIARARADEKVREVLGDTEPLRVVARVPQLINFVTGRR